MVDEVLYAAISPEEAIVGHDGDCRHADKSLRAVAPGRDTGAAESLAKALSKG